MQYPDMQRVFFFSGKVMLDDGTPPPDSVVIERVCNGVPRPEAYTDSKGRFHFQLGQNSSMMADASTSSNDGLFGGGGGGGARPGMPAGMGGPQITERDLMGCELRANLAGFRSDVVSLAGRRSLDNPDVGTLVLHRMAKVDGFTFSATSAYAPKDARKAYEKGKEQNKKHKLEAAEKELRKAVTEYPKYAAAWYELGSVYHQQSKLPEAREAYQESTKADAKFITPYAQLARIAASEGKWEETAGFANQVIKLNPFFSPDLYFLNGVANLNLNKLQEAEENAREALKLDTGHKNPRTLALMGVILAQKADYKGAAENLRTYLKVAPDSPDAGKIRDQLAQIEKQMAAREDGSKPPGNP
jgi:tetratricopeptide (TPR) repeat protein